MLDGWKHLIASKFLQLLSAQLPIKYNFEYRNISFTVVLIYRLSSRSIYSFSETVFHILRSTPKRASRTTGVETTVTERTVDES